MLGELLYLQAMVASAKWVTKLRVEDAIAALQESRRLKVANDLYFTMEDKGTDDAFWIFTDYGVRVMSTDGSNELTFIHHEDMCEQRTECSRGNCVDTNLCRFRAAVTDGANYVFATKDEDGGKLSIFSLTKGTYLGSIPTCTRPISMDYAPHRDEIWVHCFSPDEEDEGQVDIFSTTAWGLDHSQVQLPNQTLGTHTHGWIEVDAITPDYAWATTREHPYLARINVHTKAVHTIDMAPYGCAALNEMAASWRNKHLYVKCHVCCSCGVDGDTGSECSGNEDIVTLNDGTQAPGNCGIRCDGSKADTIGVLEVDLADVTTPTVLTNHYWPEFGSATPFASPGADFIVFESRFGDVVKILAVTENGQPLNDDAASDVATNFTDRGHRESLFVEDDNYDLVIFSSIYENYVVIADLAEIREGVDEPTQARLTYSMAAESTGGHTMAWATGTPYAMVTGTSTQEIYLLDLGRGHPQDATVAKTMNMTGVDFVAYFGTSSTRAVYQAEDGDDGKDANKVLSIVAIVLSAVAIVLVFVTLTITMCSSRGQHWKDTSAPVVKATDEIKATDQAGSV